MQVLIFLIFDTYPCIHNAKVIFLIPTSCRLHFSPWGVLLAPYGKMHFDAFVFLLSTICLNAIISLTFIRDIKNLIISKQKIMHKPYEFLK